MNQWTDSNVWITSLPYLSIRLRFPRVLSSTRMKTTHISRGRKAGKNLSVTQRVRIKTVIISRKKNRKLGKEDCVKYYTDNNCIYGYITIHIGAIQNYLCFYASNQNHFRMGGSGLGRIDGSDTTCISKKIIQNIHMDETRSYN